jgi:hypothetical protein
MRETLRTNFSGDAELTQALKSLKQKRVFKTPSSVKLLEVRIAYYHNSFNSLRISMLLPMPKVGMKRISPRMRLGTYFSTNQREQGLFTINFSFCRELIFLCLLT